MSGGILAVASGGGHWVQLMRLRPAFDGLEVAYVSRDPSSAAAVPGHRFYTIGDASRHQKLAFAGVLARAMRILLKERPAVVVTTGAAPGLILLVLAKRVFGARTIWIDSIANVERLSGSGLLAARHADLHLTQWPDLANGDWAHWGSVL